MFSQAPTSKTKVRLLEDELIIISYLQSGVFSNHDEISTTFKIVFIKFRKHNFVNSFIAVAGKI